MLQVAPRVVDLGRCQDSRPLVERDEGRQVLPFDIEAPSARHRARRQHRRGGGATASTNCTACTHRVSAVSVGAVPLEGEALGRRTKAPVIGPLLRWRRCRRRGRRTHDERQLSAGDLRHPGVAAQLARPSTRWFVYQQWPLGQQDTVGVERQPPGEVGQVEAVGDLVRVRVTSAQTRWAGGGCRGSRAHSTEVRSTPQT